MAARWKDGAVTLYCKSGHVLTFDGGVRLTLDSDGYPTEYDTRGGPEYLLLPYFSALDAISVTSNGPEPS